MGRSLGSGIAVYAASQTPVEALILVTPYFSLEDVAANQYPYLPARFLLRDKYASYQYAPAIKAPVYMLVAEWDQLTPMEGSVALQRKFAPGQAQMVVVKQAWHNGISNKPEYTAALSEIWKTINQR
ncbi:MAG: hypothetical protein E6Q34_06450 [Burkholderiaceae bacterium]|nr:MAG: hypothetical protein E6Q34_06450 [Burkholderiaceae bacterium]